MKLVLQKDVKNLGKAGDQVEVKNGYARNYLLPKNLALVLNKGRIKQQKHKEHIVAAKKKKAVSDRKTLIEQLSSISLTFERESHEDGRLFGSLNAVDISKTLEKEHNLAIDKRDIAASEGLKTTGEHNVLITLDAENKTELKIKINKRKLKKEIDKHDEEERFSYSRHSEDASDQEDVSASADVSEDIKDAQKEDQESSKEAEESSKED